ncbi:MAG: tetratricopeptide repeat protein, partial [Ktedonobacteraceae bacterium]|nr:tetratricopeptide repeat protein [Ktedonobacteraceae bacterium]
DPPIVLSRWRVRGQMIEIRDNDLRLSEQETASFLRRTMGLHLEEEGVIKLWSRTEGWIASLQLAALSLSRSTDPSTSVKRFGGSHRFILDYIQEEILARQPPAIQQFLLQTAVLSQMNASLCQVVTGEQSSQELLEALERANLFLVPLDEERQWYRFHHLFREALFSRLLARQPGQVPLLHRRAATWYEACGLLHEAIPHALESEDEALAADLIERFMDTESWRNEYHTLRRWLARLSREILQARPGLSFMYALAMVFTSRRGPQTLFLVEEPLRWAEQGYRTANNQAGVGSVLSERALLIGFQGDYSRSIAYARQALALLPEHDHQWRSHCLGLLGIEAFLAGQLAQARQLFQQSLACYKISGSLPGMVAAIGLLGEVCFGQGELRQATHYYHQALSLLDERQELIPLQLTVEAGTRDMFYEQRPLYGLAGVLYEQNHLTEAQRYLNEALSGGQFMWLHILTTSLLLQVRLRLACGEEQQAREHLSELAVAEQRPEVYREIHLCQAYLAFRAGDLVAVEQWAASYAQEAEPLSQFRREEEILLLARLRIARHQPEIALELLAPWKQKARSQECKHSELQILVLEALAYEATGTRVQAREVLLEVVTQASREGYQRLFLDEGKAMENLLKSWLPHVREMSLAFYVQALLRAFDGAPARPDIVLPMRTSSPFEPLTPQEQRVLRLLAEGASNQQIAHQLVISLATARKHVSNILSKLGAENRTQAVARAREYKLF